MDDGYPEFEEIDHTADLQIIAYGKTLEELFTNAGKGMYQVISARPGGAEEKSRSVILKENDPETLLVAYLEELLFLADHGLMTLNPRLNISLTELNGDIPLYSILDIKTEIKAVTYHEMEIVEEDEVYRTKITFDV
jgi:SHS2 domain-containing protein